MHTGPTTSSMKPPLDAEASSRPSFHRRDQASLVVRDDARGVETREERDDEEYIYVHPQQRSPSEASESLTVHFLLDDREPQGTSSGSGRPQVREAARPRFYEYVEEDVVEIVEQASSGEQVPSLDGREGPPELLSSTKLAGEETREKFSRRIREWEKGTGHPVRVDPGSRMASSEVDYSRQDFRRSRALIDEAARNPAPPPNTAPTPPGAATEPRGKVKVHQVGDTTIVTEHRDPYSFYWQLDRVKKAEEPPPRRLPPADYIIDEEVEEEEEDEEDRPHQTVLSPDSHDSGINVERPASHYSRPLKEEPHRELPAGWEKHEDPSGFSYYWHVDSGTVQREPPAASHRPLPPKEIKVSVAEQTVAPPPPPPPQPPIVEEHAFRQVTTKRCVENEQDTNSDTGNLSTQLEPQPQTTVRFMVRTLGSVEIPEEELTTQRSSRAINEAIEEVTAGNRGRSRRLGGGRGELIMELDDSHLKLLDPDSPTSVVHSERIEHIRVWGVGRSNARDFAYVARDPGDRHHFLCHVFRCDNQARVIANALQEACNRRVAGGRRPTSLDGNSSLTGRRRRVIKESPVLTPMDEPKKAFRCHFIGVTQVPRATGMHVLNEAVDRLVSSVGVDKWVSAKVLIAPSAIDIHELDGQLIAHCRVRYLSFLGIGRDIKCYVFHVEPNAATMAKTVEAACKLRYQKVLDAHLSGVGPTTAQRQFTPTSNGSGHRGGAGTGNGQFHSYFE